MEEVFSGAEETLYSRGDIVTDMSRAYYIKSGTIGLFSINGTMRSFLFAFKQGEFVAGMPEGHTFISGRRPEYIALDKVVVKSLAADEFIKRALSSWHIKAYTDAQLKILTVLFDRLDNVGQGAVFQRLLERLIFFAERLGEPQGEKIIINSPMPHSDIATSINSTRETVNRFMKQLEKQGVISLKNQTIVINSLAKLRKLAAGDTGTIAGRGAAAAAGLAGIGLEFTNLLS